MDLIVRNAKIRVEEKPQEIGFANGRIAMIGEGIRARGTEEIDVKGRLTSHALVNPDIHLDKALLGERLFGAAFKDFDTSTRIPSDSKRHTIRQNMSRIEPAGFLNLWLPFSLPSP